MTTVPIDVLFHVIEFIDHPKDLLSFALTSRAWYVAIVPRHIDYRRISVSCTKSSERVWKHLLDTPNACSYIRYLNILIFHIRKKISRMCKMELRTQLPFFSLDDIILNVISDTFTQALSKMVNLKVLRFETTGPNEEVFHLISEAIGRAGCASLEELEIHFQSPNTAIEQRFEKDKVSRDLKTFSLFYDYLPSLRKYIIKSNNHYDSGVFLQMLLNTPNLTYMDVTSGLSSAFFSGCWPNLQHLRFMSCPTEKDYLPRVQTFFRRHSKLITLSTHNILLPGWATESDDFLPNLKSLYVSLELHPHTITANIAARLAHLEMNPGLYSYLAECGIVLSNLETCVYFNAHLEESIQKLVVMTPNIQKLHISFDQRLTLDEIMERVSHFAGFKNLRVLIGPLDEVSVDSYLPFRVLYDFPRFLYTRMNLINQGRKIFRLERDDIAKVMKYKHEEAYPDECKSYCWDSIYRHGLEIGTHL